MSREIFEIIIVTCIILIPVVFYISYIIESYRYYKVFKNLSIGDEYDWIVRDIDDPFEPSHTSYYKVVNKKNYVKWMDCSDREQIILKKKSCKY